MALADTAKLVASLELQDKFSKPLGAAGQALGGFERKVGTLSKLGDQVGRGFQSATQNLTRLGIAGAGLLTLAVTNGVRQLELLENATAQTNAVLASTSGVAGQTAESIRNLAEKYEGLNATIDDKVIQSGENLLLTFTNISKEAFEPALVAALNLNQALGGGEEGLQNTIIQVGKALQDPIRGLTNLRRVGVNFTEQQKQQIKQLVAANDLYGAQQIILQELGTEFGGSFAAAGDTATAKFAKVRDAVEDAQAALATAFLPVLEKVADKLGTFLADPATVQRIEDFGGQLAGGFDKVLEIIGKLDFGAIGDALTIAGTGAKAVFDAFTSLPPWIQTAVLTGWGLNKLTGGALTGIAGTLGKAVIGGLVGGTRGSTPANPVFVSAVGGVGGAPVVGGVSGATLIQKVFMTGIAVEAGFLLGSAISNALVDAGVGGIKTAKTFEQGALTDAVNSQDVSRIVDGINSIDEQLKPSLLDLGLSLEDSGAAIALALDIGGVRTQLEADRQVLLDQLEQMGLTREQAEALVAEQTAMKEKYGEEATKQINAVNALKLPLFAQNIIIGQIKDAALDTKEKARLTAANTADTARWTGISAAKKTQFTVNVKPIANISISNLAGSLTTYRIAGEGSIGGFTTSAI